MSAPLTTRIPIKDRDGNVIGEKEVATYAGVLAKAHEEGLSSLTTVLTQVPNKDNGNVAIVTAIRQRARVVSITDITKAQASKLIDSWKPQQGNGASNGA